MYVSPIRTNRKSINEGPIYLFFSAARLSASRNGFEGLGAFFLSAREGFGAIEPERGGWPAGFGGFTCVVGLFPGFSSLTAGEDSDCLPAAVSGVFSTAGMAGGAGRTFAPW